MLWLVVAIAIALGLVAMATAQFGLTIWLLALGAGAVTATLLLLPSRSRGAGDSTPTDWREDLFGVGCAAAGVALTFLLLGGVVGVFVDDNRIDTRRLDECIAGTRSLSGASYSQARGACLQAQR
jgi:hypothetical protein